MGDIAERIRAFWDADAETYDLSPSHALTDPVEAAAWRAVLRRHLPGPPARVLDAGAGTGAITVLLAELGYRVTALDLSEPMLARAREKLRGFEAEFAVGPAHRPPPGPFDAVVERNMLWTSPDPARTLRSWREVTVPGGRVLAMEGLHRPGVLATARSRAADALRRVLGIPHDHHDHYDPDVTAALPLLGATSPAPLLGAVRESGWSRVRLERLRDVEWARRLIRPRLLSRVESVPLYAVAADA